MYIGTRTSDRLKTGPREDVGHPDESGRARTRRYDRTAGTEPGRYTRTADEPSAATLGTVTGELDGVH